MNIDHGLVRRKTEEYATAYAAYVEFAAFLQKVLENAGRRFVPGIFVEARAKSPSSFAEKIVRKQYKFNVDQGYDITDRCGARVIAQSAEDVAVICAFIEKNFLVDPGNSLDHRAHLRTGEFGYRSIHYVVQMRGDDIHLAGVVIPAPVAKGGSGFKAEIQVRTLAEHVLASGLHDRLYKARIAVPEPLKRENARLAAILESVDASYSALASGIDAYLGHYSAYLNKSAIADEIAILEAARAHQNSPELTLRMAILARLNGDLARAQAELDAAVHERTPALPALQLELGYVLCLRNSSHPESQEFERGQQMLTLVADEEVREREPDTSAARIRRAEGAHRLAWSYSLQPNREEDSRNRYRQAWMLNPTNPYHLTGYVEYEIFWTGSLDFLSMLAGVLRDAVATCRRHIAVGIEVLRAHFTSGRLHLFLRDVESALLAYLAGIACGLESRSSTAESALQMELDFFRRLRRANSSWSDEELGQQDLARRVLLLGLAVFAGANHVPGGLRGSGCDLAQTVGRHGQRRVLIVAGGAKGISREEVDASHTMIERALKASDGLVLAGGTTQGIPGLVGEMAGRVAPRGQRPFHLVGYIPHKLTVGVVPDEKNYDELVDSGGEKNSVFEPVLAWTDMLRAGIEPQHVRLLCVNGGRISAFEMRLALALGATVAAAVGSGREADAILRDPVWGTHPRLVPIPDSGIDDATMRALVRPSRWKLSPAELDQLAANVHLNYLKSNVLAESDYSPERRIFDKLRADLQESNRRQVLYAAEILSSEGFTFVKHAGPPESIAAPVFTALQVERMAELEHGRWNIERLTSRWMTGLAKDSGRRVTPYLGPYTKLDDDVKQYDRDVVINYAAVFKLAGYAIVPAKTTDRG